jgi:deoxyribose-phosphate aldolase
LRRFPGLEREDLRACVAYAAELAPGSRAPELEQLIARRFPPEGRKERVERAVQAVREFCGSFASKVDLETVKWVAQDADILDI